MQRIIADFNRLGLHEPDVITIATEDRLKAEGIEPREGERAIIYEPGSLEAEGTLFSQFDPANQVTFWCARQDMSTLHEID